jgi:hypothetical protein
LRHEDAGDRRAGTVSAGAPIVLRGEARTPGGTPAAATVTLGPTGFTVVVGGAPPWEAAYRDAEMISVDGGGVLVQLGRGPGAERWLFERFGQQLGALARGLRDGRLREWLADGLADVSADEPIELVEFAFGSDAGVAQLLYHRRGVVLAPLDERLPRLRIRRADIGIVEAQPDRGRVRVSGVDGPVATGRAVTGDGAAAQVPIEAVELRTLGQSTSSHAARWTTLRDAAAADVAAILAGFIPDAPFEVRRQAAAVVREGRPADATALGDGWARLERAVLVDPTFAESYRALVARAGGTGAARWLAMAPVAPGNPSDPKAWFLVGLPGNLVALELVSTGAHATYLFRVAPRAAFVEGTPDSAALAAAVRDVSEALIDARFLREPMALPAEQLAEPRHLRYRLAIGALPSLAAARARFVARIVHRDAESWGAALDDLIRWHGTVRDEAAEWPGRAGQETMIDAAGAGEGGPAEA